MIKGRENSRPPCFSGGVSFFLHFCFGYSRDARVQGVLFVAGERNISAVYYFLSPRLWAFTYSGDSSPHCWRRNSKAFLIVNVFPLPVIGFSSGAVLQKHELQLHFVD